MPTRVTDVAELDTASVQQNLAFMQTFVEESHPEIDTRYGSIHNLLLLPSAEHAAANQEDLARYANSSSLLAITNNPTTADASMVDAVMGTRGITRNPGSYASGTITVVLSAKISVFVASGTAVTRGNQSFTTTIPVTARTSVDNVASSNDRVLQLLADGNYAFTIPVIADAIGPDYILRQNDSVAIAAPISSLVRSYASEDFLGGDRTETNAELLLREQEGIASEALSGRINGLALLRATDSPIPNFIATSIIGLGDGELLRDKHSIFPGSFGGRSDWYIRPSELPVVTVLTKTATFESLNGSGHGIWHINITRDDAPGYCELVSITLNNSDNNVGTFPILSEQRSFDPSAITDELVPDIDSPAEAVYSRFQTCAIKFTDTVTDASSATPYVTTGSYKVAVRYFSGVAETQSYLASRKHRNLFGDVLVKAPIPCFTSISFTLVVTPGTSLPDPSILQNAVAQYVNRLGFPGRLYGTAVAEAAYAHLPSNVQIRNVDLYGKILKPNGETVILRSPDSLEIPTDFATMVSARTVGFLLQPEDVRISASVVANPQSL